MANYVSNWDTLGSGAVLGPANGHTLYGADNASVTVDGDGYVQHSVTAANGSFRGFAFDAVTGDPDRSDFDLLALFAYPVILRDEAYVIFRASVSGDAFTGYGLRMRDDEFRLSNLQNATSEGSKIASGDYSRISDNTYYAIRLHVEGASIRARLWTPSDYDDPAANEPANWQLDATDSTHQAAGLVVFATRADATGVLTRWRRAAIATGGSLATFETQTPDPVIFGIPFSASVGVDRAPTIAEGEPVAPVTLETGFSASESLAFAPAIVTSPASIGIPFSGNVGADFAPAVEIPSVTLDVPLALSEGADYRPGIAEAELIALPYAGAESVDYAPDVRVFPVPIAVPFGAGAERDFAPAIEAATTGVPVPFTEPAGADYPPEVSVRSAGIAPPFAAAGGLDWSPEVREGFEAGVVAPPFAVATGEAWAPRVEPGIAAGVLAVPFAGSSGVDRAPTVVRRGVVFEVPFAGAAGIDHAPAVEVGSLIVLVPFAAAAGVEWAPAIRDGAGLPLDVLRLTHYITRTARIRSAITRTVRITSEV